MSSDLILGGVHEAEIDHLLAPPAPPRASETSWGPIMPEGVAAVEGLHGIDGRQSTVRINFKDAAELGDPDLRAVIVKPVRAAYRTRGVSLLTDDI